MEKTNKPQKKTITYTKGSGYNVRLKGKIISGGKISLFLEKYNGYTTKGNGKPKANRETEYLKIFLFENPNTPEERKQNKADLEIANQIRNLREVDLKNNGAGLVSPFRKKSNFFDYCEAYEEKYKKADKRMIKGAIREFKAYSQVSFLTPLQIDQVKIKGFRDYLLEKYKGETPHSYFARFKKIVNAATEEGLFVKNPGDKVICPEPKEIRKQILMPDEIHKLALTECGNPQVKRAFLLSCNTGLRFNDIIDLRYNHIVDGCIKKQQNKTGRIVTIKLNKTAIKLIGEIGKPEDLIFNLPSFTGCLSSIRTWAAKAGINKKITWHSARHTFGTLLTMNNANIVTVQNLMGHSKLENTQKYTHLVEQLREQAVDTLPDLDI